jgi:Tol biopolymer transport system component
MSPDGQVAFTAGGTRDIHVMKDTGIGDSTALVNSPFNDSVQDWSTDGKYIAYLSEGGNTEGVRKAGLYVLPLFGDRRALTIVETGFGLGRPQFSYDLEWIAYMSNETGKFQVSVISFPAKDKKRQISANGGAQPRWRRDGKELFYLSLDGKLMAVELNLGAGIEFGKAQELFDTQLIVRPEAVQYAVTPNGQRFLLKKRVSEENPSPASAITVIVNWAAKLRR